MNLKKENKISFNEVNKDLDQIKILYELLKKRDFTISHRDIPPFDEHKMFVINNPYRAWYLVKENNSFVGSFYIKNDNSIGINIKNETKENVSIILEFIKKKIYSIASKKINGTELLLCKRTCTKFKLTKYSISH